MRLPQAPVIDGRLDPAWLQLDPLTPFYDLGTITDAARQSRAYVTYDDQALYVALDLDDDQVIAAHEGTDAPVWEDDDVEVFIQPAGSDRYYQFAANALGGRYDGRGMDASYNADWEVRGARTNTGWSLEMRIPFAAVGQTQPARGAQWRLGLGRQDLGSGPAALSCWPVFAARDFHLPGSYAPMVFE